jgi:hypothetical protein
MKKETSPVINAITQQAKTLTNTNSKPTSIFKTFSTDTANIVGDFFTAKLTDSKATIKLQDTLRADGYKSYHFDRTNKEPDAIKFHEYVKGIFIARMDADAQALIKKEKASLNNTQQALQQFHKDFISTQFGNLHKAMKRLEDKTNVKGKTDKITDDNVLALRDMLSCIKRLQDTKNPCKNAIEIIAQLREIELLFKQDGITVPKK